MEHETATSAINDEVAKLREENLRLERMKREEVATQRKKAASFSRKPMGRPFVPCAGYGALVAGCKMSARFFGQKSGETGLVVGVFQLNAQFRLDALIFDALGVRIETARHG